MAGINIVGFVTTNCGLGVAARNTTRLLAGQGHRVGVLDLRLDGRRSGHESEFDHLMIDPAAPLPHPTTIFHINPPLIGQLREAHPEKFGGAGFMAAVPFWELPVLPANWVEHLQEMDAILCPSRFIEQAVANALDSSGPAIRYYSQTAFLPVNHRPDRARFGLPEKGTLFVMSFEMGSDMSRKNPFSAISAFNHAFASEQDAYLIVKLNNASILPEFRFLLDRLRETAAANPRILIRDETLSYEEVISLYESCDVYVSTHRSEGLGLGLMEAMLLGKPVIATGWSGNMDFMDDRNSCLVGYRLVPVESPVYLSLLDGRPAHWADPDVGEVAWWMRRLHDRPELRKSIGETARADMETRRRECEEGRVFASLLALREKKRSMPQEKAETIIDLPELFARVSALIKKNEVRRAIALYDLSRVAIPAEGVTPELVRFDQLMGRLKEKAGDL